MKKFTVIVLCLAMLFCLAGCKKSESPANLPNPMVTYNSLDELNEKYNINLVHPAVMGVTDEKFFGIDTEHYGLGEYDFTLNGYEYTLRGTADTFDDISGVYVGGNTIFYTPEQGEPEADMNVATSDLKGYRWFIGEKQYVLLCKDGGKMDAAQFESIATEIKSLTDDHVAQDLSGFVGSYADPVSMRASLEVTDNGDETLLMVVTWGNSAKDADLWEMNAIYTPDGALYYTDGVHYNLDFTESEEGKKTVVEDNQSGSFTPSEDGKLAWMGAADDFCRDLVFEKVSQNN